MQENHFYDLSIFAKEGTAGTYNVNIYDDSNSTNIYLSGDLTETAGDWSEEVSERIETPDGCTSISIFLIHRATGGDATAMEHNGDLFVCDHFVYDEYRDYPEGGAGTAGGLHS